MEKKKKGTANVISIAGIILISIIIIITIFMKPDNINQLSQSQEETKPKAIVDTSTWDTSKVTIYTDKSGNKAPIPVGYVASQVTGETEINTGLVIYEGTEPVTGTQVGVPGTPAWTASCERNQWVWVPVPDVNRIYDKENRKSKLYKITQEGREKYNNSSKEPNVHEADTERYFSQFNLQGMTKDILLYEIEIELEETIKSIEKYGGFYIGRYETGNRTNNLIKPVIKRMNKDIDSSYTKGWYNAYMDLRTLGVNENVKSNIIYGCLWDETLQWFRESGAKTDAELFNSATWGNHQDSEEFIYYTNVSGSTGTKTKGSKTRTPTGATERNKANNIYDMAGNEIESTMESQGYNSRENRGGVFQYTSDFSVDFREEYSNHSYSYTRYTCVLLHKIEISLTQSTAKIDNIECYRKEKSNE